MPHHYKEKSFLEEAFTSGTFWCLVVMASIIWAILRYEKDNPHVCVEEAKVTEIIELQYRDAIVRLDTGKDHRVNQATLKPGDTLCLRSERQPKSKE